MFSLEKRRFGILLWLWDFCLLDNFFLDNETPQNFFFYLLLDLKQVISFWVMKAKYLIHLSSLRTKISFHEENFLFSFFIVYNNIENTKI